MKPSEFAELELIASELEKFGMRRNAIRIRAVIAGEVSKDDERPYPMQDHDYGNKIRAIPWGLMEILYPAYGYDQSLETLSTRGGFGRRELGMLAMDCYSQKRTRLDKPPLLTIYEMAKSKE